MVHLKSLRILLEVFHIMKGGHEEVMRRSRGECRGKGRRRRDGWSRRGGRWRRRVLVPPHGHDHEGGQGGEGGEDGVSRRPAHPPEHRGLGGGENA